MVGAPSHCASRPACRENQSPRCQIKTVLQPLSGDHGYNAVLHASHDSPFRLFCICLACIITDCACLQMRIDKIGVNRDSAHERRRLEIYALNTILCASEDARLQQLIQQHAKELDQATEPVETERMLAIAALPDSDDDKHQGNSPRSPRAGCVMSFGSVHKI